MHSRLLDYIAPYEIFQGQQTLLIANLTVVVRTCKIHDVRFRVQSGLLEGILDR
jgi:hypothetical protein